MNRHIELVDEGLTMVGGRAEAEIHADVGVSALTRFANSFIHQNVSENASSVTVRVARDGRVASATGSVATTEALRSLIDTTIETAGSQPVDGEWPGFGGVVDIPDVEHWDEVTADADPIGRAEKVKAFVDAGDGLLAAGYCATEARHHAYGNTQGRRAAGRFTTAILDGIHQTGESAGSGHAAGVSLDAIDGSSVGGLAARRAEDARGAFDTKPGDYEVVLSPECSATIAVFLDAYGFNAKDAQEGLSFAEIGEQQFDRSIDVWDDGSDPRALYVPFDLEGTPKHRTDLITGGVTSGLLHSRRTAAKDGVASTGHANQGADVWGPFGSNVFVGGGDATVESMISGVERGIYVSTFNYCRVLDPKTLVVTGLTRNGTFMIENGRITDPVTNLRFTQSFIDAWGEGNVLGIGDDARFADSEFGPTFIHAPSMHLRSWNFTGGAEG